MQLFIKYTSVLAILYMLTSCSKDFLNENLTTELTTIGLSNIYISPNWPGSNYQFLIPSVKNGDFKIVSKPSWLKVVSETGQISDSIANIQCSAMKNSDYDKVGIYMEFLTVETDGKNYKVPVGYISEGTPSVQIQTNLNLSYNNNGNPYLPIQNIGYGILLWDIISLPDWLILDTARLTFEGIYITPYNSYDIPLLFNIKNVYSGNLTGTIVLSTNDDNNLTTTINVSTNLGTPQLNIYTNSIFFSITETTKTFSFSNYGDGMLVWEFENIPEWLSITPSSGVCNTYSMCDNIIFNCDPAKLSPGQNSASVILKTNDEAMPLYSIRVTAVAPGTSENIRSIEGNLIDAVFNKNTNVLYYLTSLPNKFIAYDVVGRTVLNEILLSKAPTCFAISDDWSSAAVGHNGYISAINTSTNLITAFYEVDYSVNHIAWAENDWYSLTQSGGSFAELHWINTASGIFYDDPENYSLDGNSIIKKVPNQAYLIATRINTSPSGFFAYDIATKSKKSYAHMDLGYFWFSENGEYIFSRNFNVYRTSSSTGSNDTFNADINSIASINTGSESYYGLHFIYHSNNYLWVLQNETYLSGESTSMYQIEDNDFTLVKKIDYDMYFQPDEQTTPFSISANYVFSNREGTELIAICKGFSNNIWVIQFIDIE